MPRKPNYRFERAERNRAKEAKREEKLKRQQERVSRTGDAETTPSEEHDEATPSEEQVESPRR